MWMAEPSFPEPTPTSKQISHIPPHTNNRGFPTCRFPTRRFPTRHFPNWTPNGAAGPRPRTSTTRGTWTSSTCLTKACQGKRGQLVRRRQTKGALRGWVQLWVKPVQTHCSGLLGLVKVRSVCLHNKKCPFIKLSVLYRWCTVSTNKKSKVENVKNEKIVLERTVTKNKVIILWE